ncbi:MAG: hypothetical protein H0X31_02415 [Nostocaceae cyanobacterium]|nr:hypothetical protein [Nostocaceae cyanobacterium]
MTKSKQKKSAAKQPNDTPTLTLKEQLAVKRRAAKEKKELTSFLTSAIFGAIFIGIILGFVGGVKAAAGGIFAILCLTLSFKYPRQALYAFLIYVPLGGTITYLLGSSPILQLAKDAFYIPALVGVYQTCQKQRLPMIIPPAIKTPLFITLGLCILTLLFVNGAQQLGAGQAVGFQAASTEKPFFMGILGLKVLLGYVPLTACAYYLLRKKEDLLLLTRIQIAITLISCLLALIQYIMLTKGICKGTTDAEGAAIFKASIENRCFVGGSLLYNPDEGVIRLPGTFVAPWQWGWFLISSSFFTFASAFSDPSWLWRMVGLGSMASVFLMAVVSGQRIALALVPIFFVVLLFATGQIANLKRFIPIGIILGLMIFIGLATNPAVVQERTQSFTDRWNASPPYQFITDQFEDVWKGQKGFLGNGLGRATNSARALGDTKLLETYYPKVLHEIGPLGMAAFLALVTSVTVATFKAYRSVKNRNFRSYGASFWVFILFISYNTYYYPLDVDPVSVYYWFFAGVILKLPELDKQERLKEAALGNQGKRGRKVEQSLNN